MTSEVHEGRLRHLVVGISGASGAIYALRLLTQLKALSNVRSHVVVSKAGLRTLAEECDVGPRDLRGLADHLYPNADIGALVASGSFRFDGMVIAPCSVKTLAEITAGIGSSLLTRAADVTLKERRRLVLMVRETPLHLGHLRNMVQATEMGAIIYPPVPAFYQVPRDLTQMVDQTVGRMLDLFDIDTRNVRRWTGAVAKNPEGITHD